MASIGLAAENLISREQLRTFYLTGNGLDAFRSQGPLRPALLDQLELPRFEQSYPLYFAESESPQPLFRRLQAMLAAEPGSFPILRDYVELIAGAFGEQIAPGESTAVYSVLDRALAAARTRLEMLHIPPQAVEQEFEALRRALPKDGWLIPFGDATLTLLGSAILQNARREARLSFARDLTECSRRLKALLAVDDRKSASSTEHVAASLGPRATSFLNPSTLAEALRRRSTPTLPMEPERRARCESTLSTLEDAIHDLNRQPSVLLVRPADAPDRDACGHALALCRRQLRHHTAVLKALRIARLEVETAFDPLVHLEALDAFDWSLAQPDELRALPVIVAIDTAPHIQECLTSFGRLLQSGLPVQVWIDCPDGAVGNLGYLPIAYQEAFALQSSIASTDHLVGGLLEMAGTLRPAVAVVSVSAAWLEAALLPLARACPLYRYGPDPGESWYRSFAFRADQPPAFEQLTFAHVAALMPAFRDQFRILPETAGPWDPAFPSLFVTGDDGEHSRAVFTRELADACSAFERRWRFLTELATPQVVKEVDPGAGERARLDGVTQAIHRVISILKEG